MHGTFDRLGKSNNRISGGRDFGFLAVMGLLMMALTGFVITHPVASTWIANAVQAEFVGPGLAPEVAPTQLAQPGQVTGTVRAQ